MDAQLPFEHEDGADPHSLVLNGYEGHDESSRVLGRVDNATTELDPTTQQDNDVENHAGAVPSHLLSSPDNDQLLLHVSTPLLCLTMAPLLVIVWISVRMKLDLERPILVGAIRSFVQLSVLGMILEPIFVRGETCSWLVLAYTVFMILLAAYESMNRSKYRFPGMFLAVLASLGLNVSWVSCFAFGIILKPQPFWDPQYVIPIVGMLLGNCINGIALSLNTMLTSLVEQAREIELYLSFGATPREATARLLKEAVRMGAVPQLNSMAVIGVISIPGMMTGQILGGSPVREAARYQMLIIYLIAMCTFGTILTEITIALQAGFDHCFRLRTDFFVPRKGQKPQQRSKCREWGQCWRLCCCCCYGCCGWLGQTDYEDGFSEETASLMSDAPIGKIDISKVQTTPENGKKQHFCLEVSNLTHSFIAAGSDEEEPETQINGGGNMSTDSSTSRQRILFQNISLELKSGEIILISGSSGAGKSTLLRLIAGLEPFSSDHKGYIKLTIPPSDLKYQSEDPNHGPINGPMTFDPQHDCTFWRRQVRYVSQHKVDLPGTPKDFIQSVCDLHVVENQHSSAREAVPIIPTATMTEEARELALSWGMDSSCLDKEWTTLSGGEAQRVFVAIALASHPRVLLLDESTSALDYNTKLLVEKSIEKYCESQGTSALWITHDSDQMERLSRGRHNHTDSLAS